MRRVAVGRVAGDLALWTVLASALLIAPAHAATAPTADAARVAAGRYIAIAANCFSCHTSNDRQPFAGGVPFYTEFGTLYSSNITSDAETGIGNWTRDDLERAMRRGIGKQGQHLYPAFPYTAFTRVSDADIDALYAYLRTLPAARFVPPRNDLKFPLNLRSTLAGWKFLYFKEGRFTPPPGASAQQSRGAYIVEALGHCSACHTPRNLLGAERSARFLSGGLMYDHVASGEIREWASVNLTSAASGLRYWKAADIVSYLKTGYATPGVSFGPMNDVIVNSTRHLSLSDLEAIAAYLKSVPAMPSDHGEVPPGVATMQAGELIYTASCGSCHLPTGLGDPTTAPPLAGSATVQAPSPASLINVILHGPQLAAALPRRQSRPAMPGFDAKLDDTEIALVATYVRNAWGNRAGSVSPRQVAGQR